MTWRSEAACHNRPDLMFNIDRETEAVRLCRSCPVLNPCTSWLHTSKLYKQMPGVIAGLTASQRGVWYEPRTRRRPKPNNQPQLRTCLECGRQFTAPNPWRKTCTRKCARRRETRLERIRRKGAA